jgi:hypothetical protein
MLSLALGKVWRWVAKLCAEQYVGAERMSLALGKSLALSEQFGARKMGLITRLQID